MKETTKMQDAISAMEKLTQVMKTERSHVPELLTAYWQAVNEVAGRQAEHPFVVPPCDWSEKQVKTFEDGGGRLIYVPDEVTTSEGLLLLEKIHPDIGSFVVHNGVPVTQERSGGGWIGVATSINALLLNGSDEVDREVLGFLGFQGQRLSTYIIASLDSWRLTGEYFDKRTESRLLDSHVGNRFVYASFPDNERSIRINLGSPGNFYPYVGTRYEALKPG
jgi:hypothetical protein